MAFTCFLSYARPDRQNDPYLLKFVEDLRTDLSVTLKVNRTDALFFDTDTLELGNEWDPKMRGALGTSQVLICLCSPSYLGCQFCGREYQVFLERRQRSLEHNPGGEYDVIIPLLWIPPDDPLPLSIARFQYSYGGMPDVYTDDGLRQMMRLKKYEDHYFEFLRLLVLRIRAAVQKNLVQIAEIPPMEAITNAFFEADTKSTLRADAVVLPPTQRGPKNSHVAYFAANKVEIANVRRTCETYGDVGWDWSPYQDKIGSIVQQVTGKGAFRYLEMNVSESFDRNMEEAANNNEIVILLIDAWTTYIERYKNALRPYDQWFLINVSVIVPWNPDDAETISNRDQLIDSLEKLFPRKMLQPPVNHFWDSVSTEEDLRRTLDQALNVAQMNILRLGKVRRKAESDVLAQQARQTGIALDVKPTLTGANSIGTP